MLIILGFFFHVSIKTYVVDFHWKYLGELLPLSTHSICFNREIEKIFLELSSNTIILFNESSVVFLCIADTTMEEEIIEALSEWPVTNSVYDQTSPLDKIDNPHSVSAFFLRNVGKASKNVKVKSYGS